MSRKIAVVTGSNGLTGQAICKNLSERGYTVVGMDVADTGKGEFAYRKCDVTDYEQIRASIEFIDAEYGTIRVLVNNAGVWHGKSFFDISPSDYDFTYGVNTRAPFFLSQEVARRLVAAGGGGVIVNLASIVATLGSGVTDYGGSKAAIVNLTKSLAKPLGPHGIRVAAVSPGTINTAMGEKVPKEIRDKLIAGSGLQRAAEPEEIASVIGFLVSDDARYITGATVDVNGGL
ncbi:3-ketoacyl-ACP reductase [Caballeronia arationis]|jgi:NAD(P)-dependent dehydrogenase (short-subunit alcohol dehydrogenase family)|uniref:NAD(P)-dependent dehydrogenase, short-chain alcohol dehydrogenase family n=1 Tax=Caballeronia arationis TaxID=1777142 RepID=A0A7Z7IH21_9BURK|nr:SDR family oxidoreductase [Caballeronia arationis]SAK65638.1 3-ketoacyl-ACP reductase [Caballeronia arationis]SOE89177.1 NAD(P)-dependent dehydrogenase, short-chain alcohol dehydrogenase family [Caballeronia arationis]